MTVLRGICIGAGYFSRYHFDAWRRLPDIEIVAVCDRELPKAQQAADEFGFKNARLDAVAAIEEFRPDFIDIITPPDSHLPLIQAAAARKLAVICQKPLAQDFQTARKIIDVVERAAIPFMVHENFRFQPWHREIKRLIAQGVLGGPIHSLHFRSRLGDGWKPDAYLARQPYFRTMPRLLVHETGVHFIDTFRFLAGEIQDVHAVLRRFNPAIAGEDAAILLIRFEDGAVGIWDANRYNEAAYGDPRYTFGEFLVEGEGGSIRLYGDGRLTVQPLGQPERDHPYVHERKGFAGDCVYFTQRHFVDRLRAGASFETSGRDYLHTLDAVEAAYESAARGVPVRPHGSLGAPLPEAPCRVIDLSLEIDEKMRGVSIRTAKTLSADGWNATHLFLYSHSGTHMDAPRHFIENAASIDAQTLDVCRGPAKVLNLTPIRPRELITVEHVARWADAIRPGDRLLLRTDWHRRHGTDAYRDELPRISVELARWLVEKKVALIGVEPPSVADVNNIAELTEVHRILFEGNIVIVEGLAHLDKILRSEVEFVALPLKVAGGDGTPVRAVAVEQERSGFLGT